MKFYRGLLAQGQVARKNGNRYPTASNMARMVISLFGGFLAPITCFKTYDCKLEEEAESHIKQCPSAKSNTGSAGENFIQVSSTGLNNWTEAVKKV